MLCLVYPLALVCACSAYMDISQHAAIEVNSVVDGEAQLPCNTSKPTTSEQLQLVLWYRAGSKLPFYTYDARGRQHLHGQHTVDDKLLPEAGVVFRLLDATLVFSGIQADDEGIYICRVEFLHSSPRTTASKLSVTIPAESVEIYDQSGNLLMMNTPATPLNRKLVLTCEATGGRPTPNVTWHTKHALIDTSYVTTSSGIVRNELTLVNLTREDLHSSLTCLAAATEAADAQRSAQVYIDLLLPPLGVTIGDEYGEGDEEMLTSAALRAGSRRTITCYSRGARPPAHITWTINGTTPAKNLVSYKSDNKTGYSHSTLQLIVKNSSADFLYISCSAQNRQLPELSAVRQTRIFSIHYPPVVRIRLGKTLNVNKIKEGSDVYFDCLVKSNPPANVIRWYHKGKTLSTSRNRRIVSAGSSLALAKIDAKQAGAYTCSAANYLATVTSQTLELPVLYSPRCRHSQKKIHHLSGEISRVACHLDARPTNVHFKWDMGVVGSNKSRSPLTEFTTSGLISILQFSTEASQSVTLRCWGSNSIGLQKKPCVFLLQLAEIPSRPTACLVTNRSEDSMQLSCDQKNTGQLHVKFKLLVKSALDSEILRVLVNSTPTFLVDDLPSDTELVLEVTAVNARGASQPYRLRASTPTLIPDRTAFSRHGSARLFAEALASILGTVALVGLLVALLIQVPVCRRSRRSQQTSDQVESSPNTETKPVAAVNPGSSLDLRPTDTVPNGDVQLNTVEDDVLDESVPSRQSLKAVSSSHSRQCEPDLIYSTDSGQVTLNWSRTQRPTTHRNPYAGVNRAFDRIMKNDHMDVGNNGYLSNTNIYNEAREAQLSRASSNVHINRSVQPQSQNLFSTDIVREDVLNTLLDRRSVGSDCARTSSYTHEGVLPSSSSILQCSTDRWRVLPNPIGYHSALPDCKLKYGENERSSPINRHVSSPGPTHQNISSSAFTARNTSSPAGTSQAISTHISNNLHNRVKTEYHSDDRGEMFGDSHTPSINSSFYTSLPSQFNHTGHYSPTNHFYRRNEML